MDKLRAMETFVRIVDGGSLTAAAAALGTSPPSVVRTLAALETALDVRLLQRTTRRIALTDEGREYYERCRRVLADVDAAETALSARRQVPRGRLRITAPVTFGRLHVAPVVNAFLAKFPAVQVELTLLDRTVDLVEEGLDLGVRIGHLPESSLVALRVGETRRVVCASPAYLKRAGTPRVPADLATHRSVSFTGVTPAQEWTFAVPGARAGRSDGTTSVAMHPSLATNQIDPALAACIDGAGVGRFLCYQVRAALATGKLRRLLREHEPAPLPIHVVYPHARLLSGNVRAFVDFALPRLRALGVGAD